MSGNSQRLVIFAIIGVFMISILGTALLFLGSDSATSDEDVAELQQEAAQQQALREQQQEALAQQSACARLPQGTNLSPLEVPEFDLPSGDVTELQTTDLTEGTGAEAQAGDCIIANYHGVTSAGDVFDSSYERGEPNRFSLNQVIQGWQQGIPGMKEGGVRVLTIPSDLAYGEFGNAPVIGPNEDLVFVVELVEISE